MVPRRQGGGAWRPPKCPRSQQPLLSSTLRSKGLPCSAGESAPRLSAQVTPVTWSAPGQAWPSDQAVRCGGWFQHPLTLAYCSGLPGHTCLDPSTLRTRSWPSPHWGPTLDSISSVWAFTCCSRSRTFIFMVAISSELWATGSANQTKSESSCLELRLRCGAQGRGRGVPRGGNSNNNSHHLHSRDHAKHFSCVNFCNPPSMPVRK